MTLARIAVTGTCCPVLHASRAAILAVAAVAVLPGLAEACFCGQTCTPKAESAVFEATVTAIGSSADPWLHGQIVISLADVVAVQGAVPRALVQGASTCAYAFRVGARYRIEASGGRVAWASQCGATRPLWTWSLRAVPAMLDWWWLGGGCRD
jgi:hypothetical protein